MPFKNPFLVGYCFMLLFCFSCKQNSTHGNSVVAHSDRVIVMQPFADFPKNLTDSFYLQLKAINANVILRNSIALPVTAYYAARNRYRADSLIHFLSKYGNKDTVVIGITNKDISTTKGKLPDWGIMGLGYCPGNACIVSTFRLSKANLDEQFYKVAIHELGHTQGLPHCKNKTCFMRDAEGGNPLNEETDFCAACKSFLLNKGWQLH